MNPPRQADMFMPSKLPAFRRTVALQMADYQKRIAERIKQERKLRGLMPIDVAYAIKVDKRTYERWEAGSVEPRLSNLRALADEWDLEIKDLRPDLEAEENQLQPDRAEARPAKSPIKNPSEKDERSG